MLFISGKKRSISRLRTEAKRNTVGIRAAINEYRTGNGRTAATLLRQAELGLTEILKGITELTEREADLVEPAVTELETELLKLCGRKGPLLAFNRAARLN